MLPTGAYRCASASIREQWSTQKSGLRIPSSKAASADTNRCRRIDARRAGRRSLIFASVRSMIVHYTTKFGANSLVMGVGTDGAMTPQCAPGKKPRPHAPFLSFVTRLRRYRDKNAAFTTTRWAVFKVQRHLSGEQSAAGNAWSAVKCLWQMIRLMHLAPYGASAARPAQMPGVVNPVAAHLSPVAITNGANAAATVTDDDRSAGLAFLVAHVLPSSLSDT